MAESNVTTSPATPARSPGELQVSYRDLGIDLDGQPLTVITALDHARSKIASLHAVHRQQMVDAVGADPLVVAAVSDVTLSTLGNIDELLATVMKRLAS